MHLTISESTSILYIDNEEMYVEYKIWQYINSYREVLIRQLVTSTRIRCCELNYITTADNALIELGDDFGFMVHYENDKEIRQIE
jgi:hypothetical protein